MNQKNGFLSLLLILVTLFSPTGFASTCVSQEEMQEIARDFSQFDRLAESEYCLDGSETSNLLDSILFMRKTSFSALLAPSSDELFSGRFENDWYGYFTGRISNIQIDHGCPKGVGAYVYGYGDTMYVCTMILTSDFTSLDRASIFMHEARHMDGFPHTTCREGARAGIRGACDHRISDGGSYAVSVETYAQIARYASDIHPALKAYSRAAAVTYADEAFVVPARVDRTSGLVVLGNDKVFYKVSKVAEGQIKADALGSTPSLGRLVPRAQHLILFPTEAEALAGYVFPRGEGEISQQAGELARRFNESSSEVRESVIDSHIGAQWMAQISSRSIEMFCERASDNSTTLRLPGSAEAIGFVYLDGYDRAHREAYVSFSDGTVAKVGCTERERAVVEMTSYRFSTPIKKAYKIDSMVWGLDQSGNLYEIEQNRLLPLQSDQIDFSFEMAPYAAFDFFDSL